MRKHARRALMVVAALLVGATAVSVAPNQEASALTTIVVNSTLDDPWDGVPGVCQSLPTGLCTLRAALGTAGSVLPSDDVLIDLSGVAGLTITTTSELVIPNFPGRSVELRGSPLPNRRLLVQAASPTHRLMSYAGTPSDPLTITGVALRGGSAPDSGGGLFATGPVTLRNVEVTGNTAILNGGGLAVEGWSLEIEDSVVSGNSTGDFGGGIYAEDTTVLIQRTEVSGNTAGSDGGGLWLTPRASSTPTIERSSFSSNESVLGDGGALFCGFCTPLVTTMILDSVSVVDNIGDGAIVTEGDVEGTNLTVAENTGGGIRAAGAFLNHSTIYANGIGLETVGASFFEVQSSVVFDGCSGDMRVSFASESVVADSGCAFTGSGTVIPGSTSDLGLLAPIGGVRTGSGGELPVAQLLDPFDAAPCRAATDARGLARPASGCEHGAVETSAGGQTNLSLTVDTPLYDSPDAITGDGICADALGSCTLRAAVMEAEAFPSTDTVDVSDVSVPISLEAPAANGTYACPVDVDARCGDLDTTFLTVRGDVANPVDISAAGRVFDIRGRTTLEGLDLSSGTTVGEDGGVVRAGTSAGNPITIRDSRLRDGRVAGGGNGGGLAVNGNGEVVLERVALQGNQAITGGNGGGIWATGTPTITATDLTVRDGFAAANGGGIALGAGVTADLRGLIQNNQAVDGGGGLWCECTDVELRELTLVGNNAGAGGAILYQAAGGGGTPLRLVNVSVLDNTSLFTSAVNVLGDSGGTPDAFGVRLTHTTIADNDTTNSTDSAGLKIEPDSSIGVVTIADSVIDRNVESGLESNCAGPIVTVGAVFIDPSNCTLTSGPPLQTADPELQPIVDVPVGSGSEPFRLASVPAARPAFTSPVVDVTTCDPSVPVDVLGTDRPSGGACDAGSVEVTGIAVRLFPSSAAPTAAGSQIALSDLPPSAVKPKPTVAGGTLLGPTVDGQELRSIDLEQSPIGSIPIGSIPIGSIPLGSIPLGSIPIGSIPLDLAGGWDAVLAGTGLEGIPQQNVTFAEVVEVASDRIAQIPFSALDLTSTPIGSIPIGSIAFATLPIGSIPIGSIGIDDWCADIIVPNLPADRPQPSCGPGADIDPGDPDTTLLALSLQGVPIGSIPLGSIPIGSIPIGSIPIGSIPIGSIDLAASPLGSIPIGSIPIGSIPIGSIPIGSIPIGSIPIGSIPIGSIPIGSIPIGSIPIGSIPIGSIDLTSSPIGSIPIGSIPLGSIDLGRTPIGSIPIGSIPLGSIPLGSIPLASIPIGSIPIGSIPIGSIPIGSIAAVVDCQRVDCATGTLADAEARGALVPGATLAQLGVYGSTVLADLGEYGTSVLAELQGVAALANVPIGSIGTYGDATVGDLAGLAELDGITLQDLGFGTLADLLGWDEFDAAMDGLTIAQLLELLPQEIRDDLTLGSLLQGVVEPGDYPWEDLDLAAAADEIGGEAGRVTFVVEIQSALDGATDFALTIDLPTGFRYVEGSLTYDGVIRSAAARTDDRSLVDAVLEARNDTTQVTVDALVPLDVGAVGRAAATLTTTVAESPIVVTATGIDQVVAEAFEVNDTPATATPLVPDTLYLTHVASTVDEDWFSIDVTRGDRLSLILSNLDADFDLTVFGPAAGALRGTPERSIVPAADGGRSLLKEGTVPAVQPLDDVDTAAPAGLALVGISANRAAADERIDTTPLDGGTYYVRVTGFQDATSRRPYALRASLTSPRFTGTCPAVDRQPATDVPDVDTVLPTGMTTLFVVDAARVASVFPDDGATVLAALDRYTSEVNDSPADDFGGELAGVIDLSSLGGVQSAYDTWDADPCNPARANGVVSAIGSALDGVLAANPTVTHVVLVGNDDLIPHARLRDATVYSNEREYASQVGNPQSPLATALSLGYLLSDDAYADANPILVGTRELFLPTIAVGRLVEQPSEIVTALDNYVDFDGQLASSTALSTGYDFLDDGARSVADALAANGLGTARLLGDTWDAAQLDAALNAGPDIASVNAHFDHFRALPADQNRAGVEENLYTLDDVTDSTGAGLERSLLFSMGCHAGLSVSDVTVSSLRGADWAQTLTGLGATFAGNTGYGYGDDAVVGATEDVMRRFATALDGSLTIGQAMSLAKQQYLASAAVVTPFDEKVVSQVVMYGLPQLRVGDETPEPAPVLPPPTADDRTGLDGNPVVVAGDLDEEFTQEDTERGSYFAFDDDYLATADQPVQPRAVVDLTTEDGRRLAGVLLTGLTSTDVDLPNPVYFTPAVDLGATAPEVSTVATTFPNALQSVSRYDSPTGRREQAVIIPGQFRGNATAGDGSGTQRLFTSITAQALYAPPGSTDDVAPQIRRSVAAADDGGTVTFRVDVDDASPINLVTVLYTSATAPGAWTEVVLTALGDDTYGATRSVAAGTEIDFFVQAVDASGNVGVSSNKGTYFRSVPVGPPSIQLSADPGPQGWFTGPVTVTAAPFAPGGAVDLTVNGTAAIGPVTLTDDGAYEVAATTPGGPTERRTVRIDAGAPTIEAQRTPDTDPAAGPVTVSLLATDAGIGVDSIDYVMEGAQIGAATVSGTVADLRISANGVTAVTATATDALGTRSAPIVVVVTVDAPGDVVAPAVECGDGPDGWSSSDVTITCQAADSSGVEGPTELSLSTSVPDGTATQQAFTGRSTACDVFRNCTGVGPFGPFQIDRADPVLDVRFPLPDAAIGLGENVVGDVGCTDVGSGVASCTIGSLDTATVGVKSVTATATDGAGNTVSVTVPYEVVSANQAPAVLADFGLGVEDVGFFTAVPRIEGSFADDGPGPWQLTVTWPGTGLTTTATLTSTTFAVNGPSLGAAAVSGLATVQVCDAAGRCGTDTIKVRTKVAKTMSPVLECVVDRGANASPRYEARFGYLDRESFWLYVPIGSDNKFSPNPQDRGQPKLFQPGRERNVFTVPFNAGNQVWALSGRTATASPSSSRCAG